MSKIAFIYPGQGAQKVGMGQEFYENDEKAKALFTQASEWTKLDMPKLCFEENEELDMTEYTQAAMVTTSLAMTEVLRSRGIQPVVSAGLSLGEYAAIVTAGAMTAKDAIQLVRKRGILMQNAVPKGKGAMAAVLGLDKELIEKTIEELEDVTIANYNAPGQIVITGLTWAVVKAETLLKEAGAKRVIMLNVSGPFHSPLLQKVGEELGELLKDVELKELTIPYVTNVTGEYVTDSKETKALLAKQVASSVCWQQSIEKMISEGIDTFVEIGSGKTLTGFVRKINRNVKTYNVETWEDVDTVVGELKC